jgi:hypothetical protein
MMIPHATRFLALIAWLLASAFTAPCVLCDCLFWRVVWCADSGRWRSIRKSGSRDAYVHLSDGITSSNDLTSSIHFDIFVIIVGSWELY